MSDPRKARVLCVCGCGKRAGVVYKGQPYRQQCAEKQLKRDSADAKERGGHQ